MKWWEQVLGDSEAKEVTLINAGIGDDQVTATCEPLTSRNIPVWINIRGNKIKAVNREDAKYVLIHISYNNNLGLGGHGMYRVGKENVRATAVPCEDFFLYYIRTNALVENLPAKVLQAMSSAYSGVDGYDYSDFTGLRYLRREFAVDRKVIETKIANKPPKAEEFPRANVTAEHHTHYRPEELWEIVSRRGKVVRAINIVLHRLRQVQGVTEAVVSTFMCYMLYARPQVAYLIACSKRIWDNSPTIEKLAETLKDMSGPLKSLQRYDILDLTQLFELQVLVNRGVGQVNWEQEREHRTQPNVVKCDPAQVYREAKEVFKMGKRHGYKYATMDINKYVQSRWEWVPSGSVHSQYQQDDTYINKKFYRHRTKFVTLNRMPASFVRQMFSRTPQIKAWASVKYEWAKQRAIYGVDLTSSVITNFAMYRCEEALKHRFPVGEDAEAKRVHKRLTAMLANAESYCYDFDDFNAQHSTEAMQAVLIAYQEEFAENMSSEQYQAMNWVIESVGDMEVFNNEQKRSDKYKLKGTLLSGWRLTTFMNSVLNYIYFKISGAIDTEGVVDSVHNGDDVLLSVKHVKSVIDVDMKMKAINARSQPAKCNIFSIGEFLRVEHKIDKDNGLGAQYLSRASATMVHSRVESQVPTRVTETLKAYVTRAEEIIARSHEEVELSAHMLEIAINNIARVFSVDEKLLKRMIQAHSLVGGCVESQEGKIDEKFTEEIQYSDEREADAIEQGRTFVGQLMPGIMDYARLLNQQYYGLVTETKVIQAVTSATIRQLAVTRRTRLSTADIRREQKYKYGRALYKYYRRIVNIPYLEKAKFVGIPPIAMLGTKAAQFVRRLIYDAADPEYTLKVYL